MYSLYFKQSILTGWVKPAVQAQNKGFKNARLHTKYKK